MIKGRQQHLEHRRGTGTWPGLMCAGIGTSSTIASASSRTPRIASASPDTRSRRTAWLAGGETVILLHPPLPLVGVSTETMRECQQNASLADGYKSVAATPPLVPMPCVLTSAPGLAQLHNGRHTSVHHLRTAGPTTCVLSSQHLPGLSHTYDVTAMLSHSASTNSARSASRRRCRPPRSVR